MKAGTERVDRGQSSKLREISAWIGLLLMLFNLGHGAAMASGRMAGPIGSEWQICRAGGPGEISRDQDQPSRPLADDDGTCCLALCCGVATTPAALVAPRPMASARALSFDAIQSPQLRPAPSPGGSARAPPAFV